MLLLLAQLSSGQMLGEEGQTKHSDQEGRGGRDPAASEEAKHAGEEEEERIGRNQGEKEGGQGGRGDSSCGEDYGVAPGLVTEPAR